MHAALWYCILYNQPNVLSCVLSAIASLNHIFPVGDLDSNSPNLKILYTIQKNEQRFTKKYIKKLSREFSSISPNSFKVILSLIVKINCCQSVMFLESPGEITLS